MMSSCLDTKLIGFLSLMAQNPGLPPSTRDQATYISISYAEHRNIYRLMAQISALSNGQTVINLSHRTKAVSEGKDSPVNRFGVFLQALVADFHVIPTVPDFEGHPIELYSILDPAIQNFMSGEQAFEFHRTLLAMEKRANEHLAHLTRKYGYHFIFRIGLQQYYMTRTVAEKVNFWKHDSREFGDRVRIQKLCYEAFERQLRLSEVEKLILINATHCSAQDAKKFWRWLEDNRVAYFAMHTCISLLNKLSCEDTKVPIRDCADF